MANINNPHYVTKMYNSAFSTTPNAEDQIEDGVDNPHTGLIKALSLIGRGNHAIKRTNGFDITTNSATQFSVTAGKVFRDGELVSVTNTNSPFTLTYTGGFPSASTTSGVYYLLVADSTNTLVIRSPNPSAINKVPTHQPKDVIIAIIGYTGSTADGSNLLVQYLTTDKTSNSISVGYEASSQYEEAGNLKGSGTGIVLENKVGGIIIDNNVDGGSILLRGQAGGVDINALVLDMGSAGNAVFSGDVAVNGNGSKVLTRNGITGNGANRILTATANIEEHQAHAGLQYDGTNLSNSVGNITASAGNIQAQTGITSVTGDINALAGAVNANSNITATTGNIVAMQGSVTGVSVGAGTLGISNLGHRSRNYVYGADANQGGNVGAGGHGTATVLARPHINLLGGGGGFPASLIDCNKEEYYIGFNTSGIAGNQSHSGNGVPVNPISAVPFHVATNPNGDFHRLVEANHAEQLGGVFSHAYAVDSVYGGNALFAALPLPENVNGREIVIHNITGFALYICVVNPDADPSQWFRRNRVNGGYCASNTQLGTNQYTNERVVNLSNILLGNSNHFPAGSQYAGWGTWAENFRDAILIKPREAIRVRAIKQTIGDGPSDIINDVNKEQGLFHDHNTAGQDNNSGYHAQWFITGTTSGMGFAHVSNLVNKSLNVPVHMTGTSFFCAGTNNILLPNSPPVGTQYSFLVINGTTNINTTQGLNAAQNSHMSTAGVQIGPDTFFELGTAHNMAAPKAVTAGNALTCVYTGNSEWQLIG